MVFFFKFVTFFNVVLNFKIENDKIANVGTY